MATKKPKTKKERGNKYFAWVVAYINADHIHLCTKQLDRFPQFAEVEPFIPTIKVLKKTFKGENQFIDVPLLFQYGFFKVPRKFAILPNFLDDLKANVSCILAWVRDPVKVMKSPRGKTDRDISIGTATAKEISRLVKASIEMGTHSPDEFTALKKGAFIVLQGYPWDGMDAEFLELNEKKKKVKVRLIMFGSTREVEVDYDNVYFSLYQRKGYDDSVYTQQSLDAMGEKGTLDKFLHKAGKQ